MKRGTPILVLMIACTILLTCNEKSHAAAQYDKEVTLAVSALEKRWTALYKEDTSLGRKTDGYLEIKNTRVLSVKAAPPNFISEQNIKYIVEFVLFTDYYGSAPYYDNLQMYDTVAILTDGTAKVIDTNLIRQYRAVTFNYDVSQFIESINDLQGAYNTRMKLPR